MHKSVRDLIEVVGVENLKIESDVVSELLSKGPSGRTLSIYENVHVLMPGQTYELPEIHPNGASVPKSIHSFDSSQLGPAPSESEIEGILVDSLHEKINRSTGPVCFALSGGVDSTLLVALARKHKIADPIVCYTADTHAGSDLKHSIDAAEALNAELRVVSIPYDSSSLDLHQSLVRASGFPIPFIGNAVGFGTICCRARQDGFQSIVDGTGADQFFGGTYGTHGRAWLSAARDKGMIKECNDWVSYVDQNNLAKKDAKDTGLSFGEYLYREVTQGNLLNWRVQHQASELASGIEVLSPFLDPRLATWINSPLTSFFQNGINKYPLREILSTLVPDSVAWRVDNQGLRWPVRKLFYANKGLILQKISEYTKTSADPRNIATRLSATWPMRLQCRWRASQALRMYALCSLWNTWE